MNAFRKSIGLRMSPVAVSHATHYSRVRLSVYDCFKVHSSLQEGTSVRIQAKHYFGGAKSHRSERLCCVSNFCLFTNKTSANSDNENLCLFISAVGTQRHYSHQMSNTKTQQALTLYE